VVDVLGPEPTRVFEACRPQGRRSDVQWTRSEDRTTANPTQRLAVSAGTDYLALLAESIGGPECSPERLVDMEGDVLR